MQISRATYSRVVIAVFIGAIVSLLIQVFSGEINNRAVITYSILFIYLIGAWVYREANVKYKKIAWGLLVASCLVITIFVFRLIGV